MEKSEISFAKLLSASRRAAPERCVSPKLRVKEIEANTCGRQPPIFRAFLRRRLALHPKSASVPGPNAGGTCGTRCSHHASPLAG